MRPKFLHLTHGVDVQKPVDYSVAAGALSTVPLESCLASTSRLILDWLLDDEFNVKKLTHDLMKIENKKLTHDLMKIDTRQLGWWLGYVETSQETKFRIIDVMAKYGSLMWLWRGTPSNQTLIFLHASFGTHASWGMPRGLCAEQPIISLQAPELATSTPLKIGIK